MKDLVPIACIGRTHGYRGAFLAQRHTGQDSALGYVRKVWVGPTPEQAVPQSIRKASWMPKGWRVEFENWDSEALPQQHRFEWLYAPRAELQPTDDGEYYLSDLLECLGVRAEDGEVLGRFTALEPASTGPDRWWFDVAGKSVGIPAVPPFIEKVDIDAGRILLRHVEEFL